MVGTFYVHDDVFSDAVALMRRVGVPPAVDIASVRRGAELARRARMRHHSLVTAAQPELDAWPGAATSELRRIVQHRVALAALLVGLITVIAVIH